MTAHITRGRRARGRNSRSGGRGKGRFCLLHCVGCAVRRVGESDFPPPGTQRWSGLVLIPRQPFVSVPPVNTEALSTAPSGPCLNINPVLKRSVLCVCYLNYQPNHGYLHCEFSSFAFDVALLPLSILRSMLVLMGESVWGWISYLLTSS